jgi:hypothetical protein
MMQARMRQMSLFTAVAVASVVLLAGAALAQVNPKVIGTWTLNVAKSKYKSGTVPKSVTLTFEAAGAGTKATVDAVGSDGAVAHWTYTANADGKDSPVTGNPSTDVVALTRIDANTTRSISKKDGKVTVTQTAVVSRDGKTMTITAKGRNATGPVDNLQVYDKQ